jgi:hypothetical protein
VARVSGAFVLALKMAAVVATVVCTACSGHRTLPIDRHVVPASLAAVTLENFDKVSTLDVDLHTAVQTREAVESEFKAAYGKAGHPRWFFHAFDVVSLDFVVARYEPTKGRSARYVAERKLRVKRSTDAERALGVMDVVFSYERTARGLAVGMSREQVMAVSGRPEMERLVGRAGGIMRYPAFCVRLVDGKVAHVEHREECLK